MFVPVVSCCQGLLCSSNAGEERFWLRLCCARELVLLPEVTKSLDERSAHVACVENQHVWDADSAVTLHFDKNMQTLRWHVRAHCKRHSATQMLLHGTCAAFRAQVPVLLSSVFDVCWLVRLRLVFVVPLQRTAACWDCLRRLLTGDLRTTEQGRCSPRIATTFAPNVTGGRHAVQYDTANSGCLEDLKDSSTSTVL